MLRLKALSAGSILQIPKLEKICFLSRHQLGGWLQLDIDHIAPCKGALIKAINTKIVVSMR